MQRLAHNILLFGEAGSGKSSVVNMIIGSDLAKTSSDPKGCTFKHQDYPASFDGYSCNIYDTAGLNEGDQGHVPHWKAIGELYTLIRKLDSVTLLICCVRGRIKENTYANWALFHNIICNGQVPVLLVMTGLEQEDDWDSTARLNRINDSFRAYNMKPKDVVVVVSIRGLENEYLKMYEESRKRLRNLISTHRRPWTRADKETWFRDIYIRAYNKTCVLTWFGVGTKVEFGQEMKGLIQEFVGQTRMKEGESRKLEDTLLAAERKIAKQETGFAAKVLEFVKRKEDPTPAKRNFTSWTHNKDELEQRETSDPVDGGQERESQTSLQAEEHETNADEENSEKGGQSKGPHNIIIFGEAGCGKSSIVNMIVGTDVAKVSSKALGCTFKSEAYLATIEGTYFHIYDTAGLNEGDQGSVPHWKSVKELYTLIRKLDGVSLLIYCVRGRIKENTKTNWILFNEVICGEHVPAVAVVTGLENEPDWQDRSKTKKYETAFESYNIRPQEIASAVSIRGNCGEYAHLYDTSQKKLRNLIAKSHRKEPWSQGKEDWFVSIYHTTYTTRLCFSPRTNVEFNDNMRGVIDKFVKATSMSKGDLKVLEDTLVKAEKKVLRQTAS